jgi:hypothetical protein
VFSVGFATNKKGSIISNKWAYFTMKLSGVATNMLPFYFW